MSWNLDVKLCLFGIEHEYTLQDTDIEETNPKDEANGLFFILHHLFIKYENKFIQIEQLSILWKRLKDMFDHIKDNILP